MLTHIYLLFCIRWWYNCSRNKLKYMRFIVVVNVVFHGFENGALWKSKFWLGWYYWRIFAQTQHLIYKYKSELKRRQHLKYCFTMLNMSNSIILYIRTCNRYCNIKITSYLRNYLPCLPTNTILDCIYYSILSKGHSQSAPCYVIRLNILIEF